MVEAEVADPRFFARSGPHDLAAIVAAAGVVPHGDRAPGLVLHGVAPLLQAGPGDVSFLDNRRYAGQLADTGAGAVILLPALAARLPPGCVGLLSASPYLAWARVCALFHPDPPLRPQTHPSACVDPTAQIDPTAEIGPFVAIAAAARIGAGCRIEAHASIGAGVVLGAACQIGAGVSISHALLGERVRVLPGARIGQDGFGFAPDDAGGFVSVPQLGRVIVGDDVEIGANTTIDRGSMRDTVIGDRCRIDNLVQIGHNVQLGQGCIIVSQAGISGSTTLEDHVMVAGQAGLTGHLHIGPNARIGAQAGVMADIPANTSVMGSPSQPVRHFFREQAVLRRQARRMARPAAAERDRS